MNDKLLFLPVFLYFKNKTILSQKNRYAEIAQGKIVSRAYYIYLAESETKLLVSLMMGVRWHSR